MNILMMTNTYLPHLGGVALSIARFSERYRQMGHRVKVVAPTFDNMPKVENDVIRIPALRHFNHTDFSLALPVPRPLHQAVSDFEPDVVHSHHPFLLGGTALRVAYEHRLPLVITHHTKYEDYTHNVPGDSEAMRRFVKRLATNYANCCDRVFVPSDSIAELVRTRGVTTPVSIIPTGVDVEFYSHGNRSNMRVALGIAKDAFVIGHLGRLTAEKNLPFLTDCLLRCLAESGTPENTCCLIVGQGPLGDSIAEQFAHAGFRDRLYMAGSLEPQRVCDAYHAMDVFAFASTSETQGMVLTEAMASGLPVVAIDAAGVREVVSNDINGRLLMSADEQQFAKALCEMVRLDQEELSDLQSGAQEMAARFSMDITAHKALEQYSELRHYDVAHREEAFPVWARALHVFESEWALMQNTLQSISESVSDIDPR